MPQQRLFSLQVSCDQPIPFAALIPPIEQPDVMIHAGRRQAVTTQRFEPWAASADAQFQSVDRSGDRWRLAYHDGTTIDVQQRSVVITWQRPSTFEDACTYLVGAPFALLLRMRNVACLHGSAVTWKGRTIAFIGPSGAGKSTIAASLLDRGATLVTDDLLGITFRDGVLSVLPAYSGVRLWPASVELLRGDPDALPRITEGWEKRILESGAADKPCRLDAIVLLAPPPLDDISASKVLMHLVGNAYRPDLVTAEWRREEFEILSAVVSRVPVEWILPHSSPDAVATRLESMRV